MYSKFLAAGTALLLCTVSVAAAAVEIRAESNSTSLVNSTACAPVHIIIARGTTETYPGTLETLAELVTEANPGTDYENIIYPATQETDTDSYDIGRNASREQLESYIEKCPKSKLVVLAYSQGVLVMGDAIAGGGGPGEDLVVNATYTGPLPHKLGEHITAMVFYGDPRHMPDQPYDIYNNNVTGKYPRTKQQLDTLLHYTERLHDYCNIDDPVCASGTNITAHLVYPELFDTKAAAFIQSKLDW